MIVTAWVLLISFGFIALMYTRKWMYSRNGLKVVEVPIWISAIIITAVSAGVIWGGLFQ